MVDGEHRWKVDLLRRQLFQVHGGDNHAVRDWLSDAENLADEMRPDKRHRWYWKDEFEDPEPGTHEDAQAVDAWLGGILDTLYEIDDEPAEPKQPEYGVSAVELQKIEVVLAATVEVVHTARLDVETAATLKAAIDTMHAQVRAPRPDRRIVGRTIATIATFAGGLVTGVAGNYLTDLVKAFHVPWPH